MPIGQLSKHVFELISSDDLTRKLPKIIVAISVRSTPVLGRTCENDEFQCIHPDDGCIPYEDSWNKQDRWAERRIRMKVSLNVEQTRNGLGASLKV